MKRISRKSGPLTVVGLLRKLSGSPLLAEYVRRLPASTVVRLIDEIGLEDSQEIVAALGPEHLRETLSIALWSSAQPGREESLDIEQLVRWIDHWQQQGDAVVSRRVLELGEDFIVACFRQLLSATDRTVCAIEKPGVDIGNYVVHSKQDRHWPRIAEVLVSLWHEEPDFVLRVLRRCSVERSALAEASAERDERDSLYEDLVADRAAQRAEMGHVGALQASLFLMSAKTASLIDLCAQQHYDLNTADALGSAQRIADLEASRPGQSRVTMSLTDQRGAASRSNCLEQALSELAEASPLVASQRMRELAYLGNILMAGAQSQGAIHSEARAARVVIATANLGAIFLLGEPAPSVSDGTRLREILERDPGVVRLFQIGFNLLSGIPLHCCSALYRAKHIQSRRPGHVVFLEMEEALGSSSLTDLVREGRYGEAKSVIDGLSAVMDSAACVALRILIDPVPAYPLVLGETGPQTSPYVDRGQRPISTTDDLARIGEFLGHLDEYFGN